MSRRLPFLLLVLSACSGGGIVNPNTDKSGDNGGDDTAGGVPDIAFSSDRVEFGEVELGSRVNVPLTVFNHGGARLEVSEVGAGTPFSVTPTTFNVDVGGSTTVTISVSVSTYGDFPVELHFASNDPDQPDAYVALHAASLDDADGDGHDAIAAGGDDCDDDNPDAYPGADEEWYDGVDENCDGLDDYDQDGDGWQAAAYNDDPTDGGGDCQDINTSYYPGAPDEPYDNRDTNCDGADDFDYDGDGYRSSSYGSGTDCDDFDAAVNVDGTETFNGKDDDCNGEVDESAAVAGAPYVYDAAGARDRVGFSVSAGDLDGDGIADAVFSAPYVDATTNNSSGRGGVAVFFGGVLAATGTNIDRADAYFEGDTTDDLLGFGVSVIGDFDGDGSNDLAASAPGSASGAGAIYLFTGSTVESVEYTAAAMLELSGGSANALGRGIGGDFDLDGDGLADLVYTYTATGSDAIGVVYGGTVTGVAQSSSDAVQITTNGADPSFYTNPPWGGDFDGDGYADLVFANATFDEGGYTSNGAVYAMWGGSERWVAGSAVTASSAATLLYSGTASSQEAAAAVRLAPDWDGDGDDEMWIYDTDVGLYVVEGGSRAPFDAPSRAVVSYAWHANSTNVGLMALAGDWTGDGISEVLVFQEDQAGSYGDTDVYSSEVQAGAYPQREGRIANIIGTSSGSNGNAGYGIAIHNHDLDGDGDSDVALGDPTYDNVHGKGYIFLNSLVR